MTADARENDDELLSAYLDGELTPEERARVEERLARDPAAQLLLTELREMAAALAAAPRRRVGRDLTPQVWAQVDRGQRETIALDDARPSDRSAGRRRGLAWAVAAIAASLLLAAFVKQDSGRDEGRVAQVERPKAAAAKMSAAPPKEESSMTASTAEKPAPAAPSATPLSAPGGDAARYGGFAAGGAGASGAIGGRGLNENAAAFDAAKANNALPARTVQVRFAQPAAADRFVELLAANSIDLSEAAAADQLQEPHTVDESVQLSAAPHNVLKREEMIGASDAPVPAAAADRQNGAPTLPELAQRASESDAATPAVSPRNYSSLQSQIAEEQVAGVLVEASPEQISNLVSAFRSDSSNFAVVDEPGQEAKEAKDKLLAAAEGVRPDASATASGELQLDRRVTNQPQNFALRAQNFARGRAVRFAVPRAAAQTGQETALNALVQNAAQQNRGGMQSLGRTPSPAESDAKKKADASEQEQVLFLLDATPAAAR